MDSFSTLLEDFDVAALIKAIFQTIFDFIAQYLGITKDDTAAETTEATVTE